jgi:hypothetical protein
VLALCVGCTPAPARAPDGARSSAPPDAPFARVPLGLCEDYPEETRSLDEARRDFELLQAAGVRVLRVSIGWDGVEPERDRYDFGFWDAYVELAGEYGVALLPYVAYTPHWNAAGERDDFWRAPPREPAELGELLGLLAARYRGRIQSWEIWNEPDNRDYWLGSAAQYAELLDLGSRAVRAAAPEARVVFGGLAGGVGFLRELFDRHGAAADVDVVNLHAYYETWNPNPVETIAQYVEEVSAIVQRHGGRQAIWMAEIGYSNHRAPDGSAGASRYAYEHSLDFQAVMLVRNLALVLSKPEVSLIAWYELKDPRPSDAMIGDDHNRHLGVAFADYRTKPAFDALVSMNGLTASGLRPIDDVLRVAGARPSDLELHAWLTGRRSALVIAWLATYPEGAAAAPAGAEDERQRLVRVRLPYAAGGEIRAFDARGRARVAPTALRQPGGAVELELELRGGDVQILEVPVADL